MEKLGDEELKVLVQRIDELKSKQRSDKFIEFCQPDNIIEILTGIFSFTAIVLGLFVFITGIRGNELDVFGIGFVWSALGFLLCYGWKNRSPRFYLPYLIVNWPLCVIFFSLGIYEFFNGHVYCNADKSRCIHMSNNGVDAVLISVFYFIVNRIIQLDYKNAKLMKSVGVLMQGNGMV